MTISEHGALITSQDMVRKTVSIPCKPEVWSLYCDWYERVRKSPRNCTSSYWNRRRNEIDYTYAGGMVACHGIYRRYEKSWGERLTTYEKLKWLVKGPFKFNRYYQHPLNKYYTDNLEFIPESLQKIFASYDLSKATYVVKLIEQYSPQARRLLDIGSGAALVAALWGRVIFDMVDLEDVIPHAWFNLVNLFPDSKIALPGESGSGTGGHFNLYTIDKLPVGDNYDVVTNVTSFGELDESLVKDYFNMIQQWLRPGGVFICINREVKGDMIFSKYPWPKSFKTLHEEESLISGWGSPDMKILTKIVQK